jgi:hypothetical protein
VTHPPPPDIWTEQRKGRPALRLVANSSESKRTPPERLLVVPLTSMTKSVEAPPPFVVRSRKPDLGDEVILLGDHSAGSSSVAR